MPHSLLILMPTREPSSLYLRRRRNVYLFIVSDPHGECLSMVSSGDYCGAPFAHRVPKVRAKICKVTPTWQSATLLCFILCVLTEFELNCERHSYSLNFNSEIMLISELFALIVAWQKVNHFGNVRSGAAFILISLSLPRLVCLILKHQVQAGFA